MKHLKTFNESKGGGVDQILRRLGIKNYTIPEDGKVDVSESVDLEWFLEYDSITLKKLPIKFGRVDGDFICPHNLTTLVGCPDYVGGLFDCSGTRIKNLNGSPRYVGNFDCSSTSIKNLKGGPVEVGSGSYNCGWNHLENLEGSPRIIPEDFLCSGTNITNLQGGPEHVGCVFDISGNKYLTSLEGGPQSCGSLDISSLPKLSSLKGMTQKVKHVIQVSKTGITSLEGCPEEIDQNFILSYNYGLKDLVGGPRVVTNHFQCSNMDLTSLDGMPNFCGTFTLQFAKSLIDPTDLKNCQVDLMDFSFTPIEPIAKLFKNMRDFKDSLDYGYFVKRDGEIKILKWKFEESLSEFEIKFPKDIFQYEYV